MSRNLKLVRYRTLEGVRSALIVSTGPKWIRLILMDAAGIRIRKVRRDEEKYMREDAGYPIEQAKRIYLNAAFIYNKAEGGPGRELREVLSPQVSAESAEYCAA